MIAGHGPLAAGVVAGLWLATAGTAPAGTLRAVDAPPQETVWLVQIAAAPTTGAARPAPLSVIMPALAPVAAPVTAAAGPAVVTTNLSDRGWIGEPTDSMAPNVSYPPRLLEPPAIERSVPVYPDEGRRLAFDAGELVLLNGDGGLDVLAGDWTVSGRPVVVLRGPHRRPQHAAMATFARVASLRAGGAAAGSTRLSLTLRSAAADLSMPHCSLYLGTGGAEGAADLAGQAKPRLYGFKRNVSPVLIDSGRLIFQIHDGPMQAVVAVRDQGAALTSGGADLADYATLAATSVSAGQFRTCLATGHIRVGTTPTQLTVDARGDRAFGYGGGTAAEVAVAVLRGRGGIANVAASAFSWLPGEVGYYFNSGTVADAMDAIAAGVFGWWGSDPFGNWVGGTLIAPEGLAASYLIEPWMLAAAPEEIGPARPPWWRARVGYQTLETVQTSSQLVAGASAATRDYYGREWRNASAADTAIQAAYPLAEDGPELVSAFEAQASATALAGLLLGLFGRPRRAWRIALRGNAGGYPWPTIGPANLVQLRWPGIRALAAGRTLIIRDVSARGDRVTMTVWG